MFERAAQAEEAEAENKILKESVNTLRTRNVELEVGFRSLSLPRCLSSLFRCFWRLTPLCSFVCWVLQALVGKYLDDIRSAQDELQLTKEQFESEINIRNRLVQLHEAKATEAGSKATELEGNPRSLPS